MADTVISRFYAVLGYDVDQQSAKKAEGSLDKVESKVLSLAKTVGGLFLGGKALGLGKSFIDEADQLNDASNALGVTTQSLQSLGYAAALSGSNLEEVQQGMVFLQRNAEAAAQGNKDLAKEFYKMGVTASDLKKGVAPDELFEKLADRIQKTTNPTKRTALAMQLLGRSGAKMIPFLSQGREGVEQLRQEFSELGLGFSDEFIQNSAEVNDSLDRLKFVSRAAASQIGASLLPAILRVSDAFFRGASKMLGFFKGTEALNALLTISSGLLILWGVSWLWAQKAMLKTIAPIALLAAFLDEIFTLLKGGKTLIGEWIDSWGGLGTVDSLVRSIGEGLKEINRLGYFGAIKQAVTDVRDNAADRRNREQRVEDLKAQMAAEQDPEKKQVIVRQLVKQLSYNRDVEAANTGDVPRSRGRGTGADLEEVLFGQATASAVNEGASNKLNPFGENITASTNSRGETVVVNQVNNNTINTTAKTDASPEEIKKHVKDGISEVARSSVDQIKQQLRKGSK